MKQLTNSQCDRYIQSMIHDYNEYTSVVDTLELARIDGWEYTDIYVVEEMILDNLGWWLSEDLKTS